MKRLYCMLLCLFIFCQAQAQEDEPQLFKKARLGRYKDITYSYEIHTLQTFSYLQVDVYLQAESKKKFLNVTYLGAGGKMDAPAELSFQKGIVKVTSAQKGKTSSTCYHLNKRQNHFRITKCF